MNIHGCPSFFTVPVFKSKIRDGPGDVLRIRLGEWFWDPTWWWCNWWCDLPRSRDGELTRLIDGISAKWLFEIEPNEVPMGEDKRLMEGVVDTTEVEETQLEDGSTVKPNTLAPWAGKMQPVNCSKILSASSGWHKS